MPDSKILKMQRLALGEAIAPTPPVPKIPDEIKERHPESKEAWEKYDKLWEAFFRKTGQINS